MSIDRRAARTRAALYDGLAALIAQKQYGAISVQDILDRANVGRATFYAHFSSKQDLLARSLERLRALLHEGHRLSDERNEPFAWSLAAFEHVAEYKYVYYALKGSPAGGVVLDALRETIADFVRRCIPARTGPAPPELRIRFVAHTFMTVMTWWLDRKPALSPFEVDAMFRHLAKQGETTRLA